MLTDYVFIYLFIYFCIYSFGMAHNDFPEHSVGGVGEADGNLFRIDHSDRLTYIYGTILIGYHIQYLWYHYS